ncbi:MAG TPA: ABC transporter permease, partial [bacterium]|nr:ABC transporter permease [bacterium]
MVEEELESSLEEKVYLASQWQLIWWRFRRHKLAIISGIILIIIYLLAIFCEFLSPYDPNKYDIKYTYAPPQTIHIFRDGKLVRPFVYGYKMELDPVTLRRIYTSDPEQ